MCYYYYDERVKWHTFSPGLCSSYVCDRIHHSPLSDCENEFETWIEVGKKTQCDKMNVTNYQNLDRDIVTR